ncbi:AMP-dependent synthetase/ligase, partial [Streptomyces sp. NPDC048279]
MRDYALAPTTASTLTGGLADSIFETADRNPTLPVLARRPDAAAAGWEEITAVELRDEVVDLAKGLIASGISPGHRVAVMARTRYEWTVFCLALWSVGAEVVPIHPTSARDQVEWILRDARCVAVVVEDELAVMTVGTVCQGLPGLKHVWQLDAGAVPDLVQRGVFVPLTTVESLRRIVMPDSTAAITYTSGTSGRPLGCALSHRGLAYPPDILLAGWGHTAALPGEQASVLAYLPFSHVYGLMVMVMCLRGGFLMGHEPEMTENALASALRSFRPTYLYAVPSVLEKLYKTFLRTAHQHGRGALFERAVDTARDFATAQERQRLATGAGPGFDLRLQHALYERTVYRKLRSVLGGRVLRATSGGSSLSRELTLFYEGIGIPVHDGYGLTESSGGITMQPLGREKSGTVGQALPGTQIQVADDGEILVRGPSVFQGYVGDDYTTRAALRGGWLATGDIGRLDPEGYLTITGRKKDIIITSSGKSVAPAPLEQRLRMHPLVHQAVVVGDDRPCVGALITLDPDFLTHWRGALALPGDPP